MSNTIKIHQDPELIGAKIRQGSYTGIGMTSPSSFISLWGGTREIASITKDGVVRIVKDMSIQEAHKGIDLLMQYLWENSNEKSKH